MKNNKLIQNIIYAFGAQFVSLLLSVLMSLIVPKLLGVQDYAYWQLFIFYVGYVGFSHLGLTDGVYLRIGGTRYEELDYSKYKTQLVLSLLGQMAIAGVLLIVFSVMRIENSRIEILFWTFIYMLVFNAAGYLGYIFQAVNETKIYSISVMIDKALFIGVVLIAVLLHGLNYRYYIIGYTATKLCALIYCIIKARKLVFARFSFSVQVLIDMLQSISIGAKLLFANIASTLILGIGRQVIDMAWGITAFGKFSFSLSLTNFFLQFIGQISMVLFPALRQTSTDKQATIYSTLRDALGVFLPCVLIAYYPMKIFLGLWLPDYAESISYLALLLPICTYDGKMQMLCNTYFKVLRKENFLLLINGATALVSLGACSFAAYIVRDMTTVVYAMVFSIAFRSIVSEIYLSRMMGKRIGLNVLFETGLVLCFLTANTYLGLEKGALTYLLAYLFFLCANRGKIRQIIDGLLHGAKLGHRSEI